MPKYTSKLLNKRVLVLGGTSGIGFCVAEAALEHGAIVTIASSQQSRINSAIERLLKNTPQGNVNGQACDLSDPATTDANLKSLLEFATKEGKLDHIVNTAGDANKFPSLEDVTAEAFYKGQHIRLTASLLLARFSLQYLNQSNTSSITFTGGVNTYKPAPGWVIPAATGSGIEGLVRGLAVDMKPVRVNLVAPGAVMTELWEKSFTTKESLQAAVEKYGSKVLTGEIGRPEDVAEAYLYFMKDKFVDGQVLLTEGGYLLLSCEAAE